MKPDLKMVIRGLECCTTPNEGQDVCKHGDCPYREKDRSTCQWYLMDDALTLLQTQASSNERIVPRTPHHTKVQYADGSAWITDECPRCFKSRDLGIWDRLIDRYAPYCRRCGQAIDWSEYEGDKIDWEKYMNRKERWEYE